MPLMNFDLTSNTSLHPVTCAFGRQTWRLPAASEFLWIFLFFLKGFFFLFDALRETHIFRLWSLSSQSWVWFSSGGRSSVRYTTDAWEKNHNSFTLGTWKFCILERLPFSFWSRAPAAALEPCEGKEEANVKGKFWCSFRNCPPLLNYQFPQQQVQSVPALSGSNFHIYLSTQTLANCKSYHHASVLKTYSFGVWVSAVYFTPAEVLGSSS